MYEDLAEFSVKYLGKLGANYSEARLESYETNHFAVKNGNLEGSGFENIHGMGVRFLINNNLGFISINNFNKKGIIELINKSVKLTKNASKVGEKINLSNEKAVKKKYKVNQKIKLDNVDIGEKIKFVLDNDNGIKELPARFFGFTDNQINKYFVNSDSTKIMAEIPQLGFYYLLTLGKGNNILQRWFQYGGTGGWEIIKKWNAKNRILQEVKALKENLAKGKMLKNDFYDVILGPEVTGIAVHESVGHPYEADRILGREAAQAGESFVTKDMINYQIGSNVVNAADDPTIENSYGYYLYDDEGVKARRRILVKDGKINEFLHNRETAADFNVNSNGSARANGYDKEAIVRMANTFVLPGDYSEDELIKGIKKGVYFKNFMEWNIDDKRFQQRYVGCEAYLIENGKLTVPVRNPSLEITTKGLWSSVDAVGKNVGLFAATCGKGEPHQGIPVFMGGPSIRLRNIRLK